MKKFLFVFAAMLCCAFAGCDDDKADEVFDMTVASVLHRPENGFRPWSYVVKIENDTNWTLFWNGVVGFDYEEGYEYRIRVKSYDVKNPEEDGSAIRYELGKVLSKEQKQSEQLPDWV